MKVNAPPQARYAVVTYPGTPWEAVDVYCSTLRDAQQWAQDHDVPADIMRILPDGELTTEY